MSLGFYNAYKAGISFGKDDMVIPDTKEKIVNTTREQVKEFEQQYIDGLITQGEKYNKVVDAWAKTTDKVAEEMMARISSVQVDKETGREKPINSIYMMSHSGARGSPAQMKQLAGMRGLMAKPSGEIIETPIISNFKEGLSVLEYFNSTHGARKGLADTALKTANSGYLTRRLVDVAQDAIINELDCGTKASITARPIIDAGEIIASLGMRVLGRTAATDVTDPVTGTVIVPAGEEIMEAHVEKIEKAGIQEIRIRSVLTCETKFGVCAKCYGRDLARGTPVNMGEAVGVIAAQSIGEPGTQLTMRTFHIGGTAQVLDQSFMESNFEGKIVIRNRAVAKDSSGRLMVMGRNTAIVVIDENGNERAVHKVGYGTRLYVDEGDRVKRGTKLAEWDPYTRPLMTEVDGTVDFEDVVEGVSVNEVADEATGITNRVIIDWRSNQRGSTLKPAIVIKDKDGKVLKLAPRWRGPLPAVGRRRPLGRSGFEGEGRRHPGPYPARKRQDPRHHRRSAACCGAVRGAPSQGSRDHRGNLGPRRIRPRLQEQAPHPHRSAGRDGRGRGVSDPEGQAPSRPGRRLHREGRVHHGRQPGAARHSGDQGRGGARLLPRQRNPGSLPAAGREHQRQAHRGDRPPDAAEGRDHRRRRYRRCSPGEQVDQVELEQENAKLEAEGLPPGLRACPCCSASPRPRCRRGPSSRRPRSRKPPACSPRRRSAARSTRWKASRRTSSSAASSRPAPAACWRACATWPTSATR